jgi:hypothetical protein
LMSVTRMNLREFFMALPCWPGHKVNPSAACYSSHAFWNPTKKLPFQDYFPCGSSDCHSAVKCGQISQVGKWQL